MTKKGGIEQVCPRATCSFSRYVEQPVLTKGFLALSVIAALNLSLIY